MVCRVNREKVTITRTGLGLEVGIQERETSQDYAVALQTLLHVFEDFKRHGGATATNQKKEVHTDGMRKQCYLRSTAEEHHEICQDFGAEQQFSFIGIGDAIKSVDENKQNAPQKGSRVSQFPTIRPG